jgi:hypothetical protein
MAARGLEGEAFAAWSALASNDSFNPTGMSESFIENLAVPQLLSGGLIRALGGLYLERYGYGR